jgi:cytoskeleton protein RodZ
MADEVDNQANEPEEASGPAAGELLAAARRELKISVIEIAKELHLDETKVRALERNEFDVLGAPVFAKGHLKKYAELVNVSPEDVLVDYYRMNRAVEMPPVVSARPRPRRELSPGPWIAIIIIIVIAVTAYFWFTRPTVPELPSDSATATDEMVTPPAMEEEALAVDQAPAEALGESEPEPAPEPEPELEPEREAVSQFAQPVIEETESPEIAAGQMRLLLTYQGDCWTEVSDATGKRLFFALGTDGRTVELSGAEPFSVLFGSPGNVSVAVNGDDYALPADARPDRPLRLTISGL